jgi:hypothetical protein
MSWANALLNGQKTQTSGHYRHRPERRAQARSPTHQGSRRETCASGGDRIALDEAELWSTRAGGVANSRKKGGS